MIGSFATLPVPKDRDEKALAYLKREFERLHAKVSFGNDAGEKTIEIDLPPEILVIREKDINTVDEAETLEKWLIFSNTIMRRYFKRFKRHL